MSLYSNLLNDPSLSFPDSSDQASRLAQYQRLMQQTAPGGPQLPAGSLPQPAATSTSPLVPYGLPSSPFGPAQPRQRRMTLPPEMMPPMEHQAQQPGPDPGIDQGLKDATKEFGPDQGENTDTAAALAKAEAALRGFRQPLDLSDLEPSKTAVRRPAMTPLEGPDTGEPNPNIDTAGPNYYAALKGPESGGNYNARNKITDAAGPYQFLPSTWQGYMRDRPELKLTMEGFYKPSEHPEQHEAAIHAYTADSMKAITPILGRLPTPGELYSMHLLGQGGGANLLKNLDKKTSEVIPDAVFRSNPWMKEYADRSGHALINRFEKMMG